MQGVPEMQKLSRLPLSNMTHYTQHDKFCLPKQQLNLPINSHVAFVELEMLFVKQHIYICNWDECSKNKKFQFKQLQQKMLQLYLVVIFLVSPFTLPFRVNDFQKSCFIYRIWSFLQASLCVTKRQRFLSLKITFHTAWCPESPSSKHIHKFINTKFSALHTQTHLRGGCRPGNCRTVYWVKLSNIHATDYWINSYSTAFMEQKLCKNFSRSQLQLDHSFSSKMSAVAGLGHKNL